jgi:hypothetical protein
MVVPSRLRVEVLPYTVQQGFLTTGLKLSFGNDPRQAIASGDDVIALNSDGSLDRYKYNGTAYVLAPFPAGCSASIVGAVGDGQIATSACDGGEVLIWGGTGVTHNASNGGTCSVADFTGDGKADVLALNGTQLDVLAAPSYAAADAGVLPVPIVSMVAADFDQDGDTDLAGIGGTNVVLLENTGAGGFAVHLTMPAPGAHQLRAADLDLDGRVDLAWETGDHAEIRRNQGSWVFAPYTATFMAGPPVSFSIGDVDGDGDLDLVSTRTTAGDGTVSYVELNRVR